MMDDFFKDNDLTDDSKKRIMKGLEHVEPKDFISFELLLPHLPMFVCGELDPKSLDKIANKTALDVIEIFLQLHRNSDETQ